MVRDFFENVYIYISEYYIVISFIYYPHIRIIIEVVFRFFPRERRFWSTCT